MKIGIPNALYFENSNLMYKTFFSELGINVVFSGITTKKIKDEGIKLSTSESCLASKIFIGHVSSLVERMNKENIDYIFIPRLCTYKNKETECVRFYAMYDICKNMFDANFISLNIDYDKKNSEMNAYIELATNLGFGFIKAYMAYVKAKKICKEEKNMTLNMISKNMLDEGKKVLIVAHPYVYEDNLLGKPICKFLKSQNIQVLYASKQEIGNEYRQVTKTLYWKSSKSLVSGAVKSLKNIDGIVYLSTFPCGEDSLVTELMQRKIKNIPSISLVIDEQTGLEGYITRLESFLDIINGNTYGMLCSQS